MCAVRWRTYGYPLYNGRHGISLVGNYCARQLASKRRWVVCAESVNSVTTEGHAGEIVGKVRALLTLHSYDATTGVNQAPPKALNIW